APAPAAGQDPRDPGYGPDSGPQRPQSPPWDQDEDLPVPQALPPLPPDSGGDSDDPAPGPDAPSAPGPGDPRWEHGLSSVPRPPE
ncbi:hypothetical protein ACFQZ2_14700, partial [Streptomonospora algeriensis]